MPSQERTVQIARTPEDVFAFLADARNDIQWRPTVVDIAHQTGTGSGTRYRQGLRGPGGSRIPADFEVTVYEPPSRFGFRATGSVKTTGEYRLAPVDGGTAVTLRLDFKPSGLARAFAPVVGRTFEEEVAALDALKELLEKN